jgi:hypothetical protein
MALNLGQLADALYGFNEQIAALNVKLAEINTQKAALEEQMLTAMDSAGTDIARGKLATVSSSEKSRVIIADFTMLEKFCLKRKALHLFERRIAQGAAKEMMEELQGSIPGTSVMKSRSLNIRKVTT